MATQSPDRPPLRADAARNRERILEVARELVAGGDLAPALNEIARRAGVGVGTVYRHFADHRALLEALVEEGFRDVLAYARAALAEKDPGVGIESLFRATLALALRDPSVGAVLCGDAEVRERTAGRMGELAALVERLLDKARKAKAVRDDVVAMDVWHLVGGVERAVRAGGESPATAERYASIVLAGLRPSRPRTAKRIAKTNRSSPRPSPAQAAAPRHSKTAISVVPEVNNLVSMKRPSDASCPRISALRRASSAGDHTCVDQRLRPARTSNATRAPSS